MIGNNIEHLLWDWNGTLFDDVDYAICTVNKMLKKRDLATLSLNTYHDLFGFPIKDYYQRIGFDFDKESYENLLAPEFISQYEDGIHKCGLHLLAVELLEYFKNKPIKQSILSAAHISFVSAMTKQFGIDDYFDHLVCLDDYLAHSKVEVGKMWLKENQIDPRTVVLVGDTVHDFEVAQEMGIDCVLVTVGHHSRTKLEDCGCLVVDCLSELKN